MKRVLAFFLAVVLMSGMLAGCSEGEVKEVSSGKSETLKPEAETVEQVPDTAEEEAVTVKEAMLYESDAVKITAIGMEESWTGTDIKLLVENLTDRNVALSGDNFVVNGITMPGYLYIDVAAGKKANGALSLYSSNLDVAGITTLAAINAKDAHIIDTDSYNTIAETPFEIVTSAGLTYIQELDESGDILFESNGVAVKARVISDSLFGETVILYVKNGAGKDIVVEADNISVNGFTVDAWMYDTVFTNTVRFCELDIFSTSLEENGIETVEDVSFTINIIDPKTYGTIAKSDELQIVVNE